MPDPNPAIALPSAASDMLAGTAYRFIRRLGEGAYGLVVEAEQVALRRTVVVKLLRRAHAEREDVVDRLRLEAQAIAALSPLTPHVVSVLDFGKTPDGRPYIVMERLEGRALKDELAERGALPPAEAVAIGAQILEGLAVAHEAGILHRDVKPDNVFLCRGKNGERIVKLIDFGLAKLVRDAMRGFGPAPLAKPTDEGVMLGTPRYFSPEQARGDAASASSDLYSAGIVLYKMLVGSDPFRHCTNVYDLVKAHLTEAPRPPSHAAATPIPASLDAAVLKALAKQPEDRHADARAFRAAIELSLRPAERRWQRTERLDGVTISNFVPRASPPRGDGDSDARTLELPRPRSPRGRVRRAAGACAGVAVIVCGAVWLSFRAREAAPSVPLAPPAMPRDEAPTTPDAPTASPASPREDAATPAPAATSATPRPKSASAAPTGAPRRPLPRARANPDGPRPEVPPAPVPQPLRPPKQPEPGPAAPSHRLFGTED